ncbi:glycosyltransferase [Sulfurimonas sp. HSL1-6]|uniref:glycosyltransferase n=1 Tax=Thiomicrolovo immobilis TaxID=3131935 RepID=UPI0031FA17C1
MKKVISLVLNSFENDARVLKENVSLQQAGYAVEVVALHEAGLTERDEVHGVPVHRIKLRTKGWSKHRVVQLFKYLEFLYRVIREHGDGDIYHCNDLGTLPVGAVVKMLFKRDAKVVYDAHEYETERHNFKGALKKMAKLTEKLFIGAADRILTVSDSIANEYARMYPVEKPALVLNCPPYQAEERHDIFRNTFGIDKGKKIFLYQGGLSSGRGVEHIIEAFKRTEDKNSVLVMMGYGPLAKAAAEAADQYANIYYHEAVKPEVLLTYTSSADFGLLFYENTCLNHYYCSPNKLFEYTMAGIPVIVSDLYEMHRLVTNNGIGVVAEENSAEGVLDAVRRAESLDPKTLKENLHRFKKRYNWENQEEVLLDVYRGLYA